MNHISSFTVERPINIISTRKTQRQYLLDQFIERMPGYTKVYVCGGINNNPWTKQTPDNRNDGELEYVLGKALASKNFISYFNWMFYPSKK